MMWVFDERQRGAGFVGEDIHRQVVAKIIRQERLEQRSGIAEKGLASPTVAASPKSAGGSSWASSGSKILRKHVTAVPSSAAEKRSSLPAGQNA